MTDQLCLAFSILCFYPVQLLGIGLVYVTLTDRVGRQVIAQPSYPSIHFKSSSRDELMEIKDKLLDVKDFNDLNDDADEEYCKSVSYTHLTLPTILLV